MYSLRDDYNVDYTRHQDLLHHSQENSESTTPLKTRVSRIYRLFLAHAGKRMVSWGIQIYNKSGAAAEFPLPNPKLAVEN